MPSLYRSKSVRRFEDNNILREFIEKDQIKVVKKKITAQWINFIYNIMLILKTKNKNKGTCSSICSIIYINATIRQMV